MEALAFYICHPVITVQYCGVQKYGNFKSKHQKNNFIYLVVRRLRKQLWIKGVTLVPFSCQYCCIHILRQLLKFYLYYLLLWNISHLISEYSWYLWIFWTWLLFLYMLKLRKTMKEKFDIVNKCHDTHIALKQCTFPNESAGLSLIPAAANHWWWLVVSSWVVLVSGSWVGEELRWSSVGERNHCLQHAWAWAHFKGELSSLDLRW